MLTEEAIAAAQPRERGYKIADGGGLHLYVTPAGAKSFRLKYRSDRVEKRLTFGLHPTVSLAEARRLRDEARWSIRMRQNPASRGPALDPSTVARLAALSIDASKSRVYFIRAADGLIKIGVSKDVRRRFATLQQDCGDVLELIGLMPGTHATEMTLHRLFAEDRDHGEWFQPSERLRDFIEENAQDEAPLCR